CRRGCMKTFACIAGPGQGGQGRHFGQLLASARAGHELARYYTTSADAEDPSAVVTNLRFAKVRSRFTWARFDAGARTYLASEAFDRWVANRVVPADAHVAFSGQALHSFEHARRRSESLELISPTAHVELA